MKISIGNDDILLAGEYELTDPSKLVRAKQALSSNPTDREILLEYDKIGGQIVDISTGQVVPHQTFWMIHNKNSDRPVKEFSDAELWDVLRKAENTHISGSRYQKAYNEWQIRKDRKTLEESKQMNEILKGLYEEWKALELRLRGTIIQYRDIEKAKELRPRVWDELRDKLSITEKFELGSSLEKPLKDIFDKKYPPEDWPLSNQWATRAIHRASGGFNFLLECLEYIHRGGTDPAYSRPAYLLLSYHTELLLEAHLLLQEEHSTKTERELADLLKGKHNHDLKELSDKIGKEKLEVLGINGIKSETKNDLKRYVITLTNGENILVEDSVTVRYDFKYDRRRNIDPDESERMRREVGQLLDMTNKVMRLIPK